MQTPAREDDTATPTSETTDVAPKRKRDKHLYQLDLVRLVTFGAVILDHVIMGVAAPTNAGAGAVEVLARYSRYGFFFLTGFVLGYQYRNRELRPLQFWRRRFKLIGIPYVTWSLFYWIYSRYRDGGTDAVRNAFDSTDHLLLTAKSIAYDLATGNAWAHLYFLFVSMQIYLVFPLVLIVLKRTWGYHRYLLLASFAGHMTLLYFMVRPAADWLQTGPQSVLWSHLLITLLPYQFFVLAGCLAALHYEAFHAAAARWRTATFAVGALVIAGTLAYYAHKVDVGEDLFRATNVFMAHNAFAYIAIIAMLYGLGSMWMERRTPGSIADNFLRTAADRSFGIYLVHAFALYELRPTLLEFTDDPTWLVSLLAYVATVVITVFIVEALRRSPLSLITTGREMIPGTKQRPLRSIAVGVGAIVVGVVVRLVFDVLVGNTVAVTGVLLIVSAFFVMWRGRTPAPPNTPTEFAPGVELTDSSTVPASPRSDR